MGISKNHASLDFFKFIVLDDYIFLINSAYIKSGTTYKLCKIFIQ